ncbi:c-type cytochrome [Autumnicola psychrophila]|uniref:C-type cytochrome n=1 Tax=Autumnicola psychrophila TaxID=3075592 RepID=A0ABU3DT99_9FLAO|nr:c-type cytochrome [Zunongwangia sp. F225]MDT0686942.1 c-type cytochrome [Zunongwangia sp. F225]
MIVINKLYKRTCCKALCILFFNIFLAGLTGVVAQESPMEEDFFKIRSIRVPEGVLLEVGGLTVLPNGDLAVSTRRGDVYLVQNPTSSRPFFQKYATGLHEVLGLAYKDGALYAAQRGELTKMLDTNNDGKADRFETVYAWPLSGNYHEYSFGPKIAADGSFFVSTNLGFPHPWWHAKSMVPWRGWMLRITEDGEVEPWATGLRSPAGLSMIDGEVWYTENQGDWVGSGGIWKVEKGDFTVHPGGLRWADMPDSSVDLAIENVHEYIDPRFDKDAQGRHVKPENRVEDEIVTMADMEEKIPGLKLPAVWLPHGILGISNSEMIKIPEGTFGPFEKQILVGDQGQSKIMRVIMEKVDGQYQGAAMDFRSGFQSGVLRMAWADDGSLFVGETNRGWGSAGDASQGLERLVWNKQVPFEMKAIRAMPDGFEVEFTLPVDQKSAEDISSYSVESFIYKYHPVYGSPPVKQEENPIKGVKVSDDGMRARIAVDNLRENFIHHISLPGVRARENYYSLVHPSAYYTLNKIPKGEKLALTDLNKPATTKNSGANTSQAASLEAGASGAISEGSQVPDFEAVQPLLQKNTCFACHAVDKKQVGPSYMEVAKRNYSNERIVELIHNPEPENWPDYAIAMPPMPQVSEEDALKIAAYINSLND